MLASSHLSFSSVIILILPLQQLGIVINYLSMALSALFCRVFPLFNVLSRHAFTSTFCFCFVAVRTAIRTIDEPCTARANINHLCNRINLFQMHQRQPRTLARLYQFTHVTLNAPSFTLFLGMVQFENIESHS